MMATAAAATVTAATVTAAKRIAIVGSGIAGLAAAHRLRGSCHITVFEQNAHLGGHAHSIPVTMADGSTRAVDVAFMVYNRRNYPRFCALLDALGVAGCPTDMSFSVVHERYNITYNGGSIGGLLADWRNLLQARFWRLLAEVIRFNRIAKRALAQGALSAANTETLREFLARHRFAAIFNDAYLLPMGASIWSCSPEEFACAPAYFVAAFFHNHGLLDLTNRPQWMHIKGGSQHYVNALLADIPHLARRHEAVTRVGADGTVTCGEGDARRSERFDAVVVAAHAPQALALLDAPSAAQRDILSAFRYTQTNGALHTDSRLLPPPRRARAAWNYRAISGDGGGGGAGEEIHTFPTYDLSRLQHLPGDTPFMLTLNLKHAQPRHDCIIAEFAFSHPLPDTAAIAAQQRFDELHNEGNLFFCGAYWGNGFHEDGVVSGEAAADKLAARLQLHSNTAAT